MWALRALSSSPVITANYSTYYRSRRPFIGFIFNSSKDSPMASRGTLLPLLLVAFAVIAGGLPEGVSGEASSFVRRRLAGHETMGAVAATASQNCPILCLSGSTCCQNTPLPTLPGFPPLLPTYYCALSLIDNLNCGGCGNSCIANNLNNPICCSGKCTNLLTDSNNCGFCGNVCKGGSACLFGLCRYAA